MRDNRGPSTDSSTMNFFSISSSRKKGGIRLHTYKKKIWRDRITLPKTPRRLQVAKNIAIELETEGHTWYAIHNPSNPIITKSHTPLDLFKKTPFHPIIGFTHIKFKSKTTFRRWDFALHGVEEFKSDWGTIRDRPLPDESWLIKRDNVTQEGF